MMLSILNRVPVEVVYGYTLDEFFEWMIVHRDLGNEAMGNMLKVVQEMHKQG